MAQLPASVMAILLGLSLLNAPPASAQSTDRGPQTQIPPIIPFEWKPDLVIASVQATTVCAAQGTVTANILVVVKNQSPKATADLSTIPWHIIVEALWAAGSPGDLENPSKQTVKPQAGGPMTLKPGQSWSGKLTIVGIPKYKAVAGATKAGSYALWVKADPLNGVAEASEKNNNVVAGIGDPCFKP